MIIACAGIFNQWIETRRNQQHGTTQGREPSQCAAQSAASLRLGVHHWPASPVPASRSSPPNPSSDGEGRGGAATSVFAGGAGSVEVGVTIGSIGDGATGSWARSGSTAGPAFPRATGNPAGSWGAGLAPGSSIRGSKHPGAKHNTRPSHHDRVTLFTESPVDAPGTGDACVSAGIDVPHSSLEGWNCLTAGRLRVGIISGVPGVGWFQPSVAGVERFRVRNGRDVTFVRRAR